MPNNEFRSASAVSAALRQNGLGAGATDCGLQNADCGFPGGRRQELLIAESGKRIRASSMRALYTIFVGGVVSQASGCGQGNLVADGVELWEARHPRPVEDEVLQRSSEVAKGYGK